MIFIKPLVFFVAALLILIAVAIIPIGSSDELQSDFGGWRVRVDAELEDGSTKTFSVVNTAAGQLLTIYVDGVSISKLNFHLDAKATGAGFNTCELDASDAYVYPRFTFFPYDKQYCSGSIMLPVNGDWQEIKTYTLTRTQLEYHLEGRGDGTYELEFWFGGTVRYRGLPGGDWQSITDSVVTNVDVKYVSGTGPDDEFYDLTVKTYPLTDFQVKVFNADFSYSTTKTSSNHIASFTHVREGEYTITVFGKDDYETEHHAVSLYNDRTMSYTLETPTTAHTLTVSCFPSASYVEVDGVRKTYSGPITYELMDGTYTVYAYHWIYGGQTKTVTMDGEDKGVIFYFSGMTIIPVFSVLFTRSIKSYRVDSTHYLGSH